MQNKRKLATWLGAALGVVLAVALNAALAHASENSWVKEEFHQTYPLAANGAVRLENINGAVHISAWDQNQVKVDAVKRAENQQELKDAEIRVDASPNAISISTHYPQRDSNWNHGNHSSASVEYTLTVPRNARLEEVQLINGALDVTGVLGEVHAECINGMLRASGLAGKAKLSTVNGMLEAKFDRMPADSIDLNSVNGRMDLTLPSDAKATLEATTVHGGIENEFGLRSSHHFVGHDMKGQLGGGGTHIRLNNVNGAIEIHHAKDGKAVSPAKSEGGDSDEI